MGHHGKFLIKYIITGYTSSSLDTLHHHWIHCIITGYTTSSLYTLRHHWILFSAAVAAFDIAVDGSLARMVRASLFSATPSVIVLENLTNWQELNVNITYRKMT